MREILFRGKDIAGNWHYGVPLVYAECLVLLAKPHTYSKTVEANTVGQYIGLTDKNGTKIFEGDIVTMPSYHGGKHKTVVYFKNGKFAVDGSNYSFKDIAPRNMEVIGNIHDNPELLKECEG